MSAELSTSDFYDLVPILKMIRIECPKSKCPFLLTTEGSNKATIAIWNMDKPKLEDLE
jgi:hypothetical protein